MTVGEQIRRRRRAAGLQQGELARKLGVTQQSLSAWENDRSQPSPARLKKIAAALGASVADLMNPGDGSEDGRVAELEARLERREREIVDLREKLTHMSGQLDLLVELLSADADVVTPRGKLRRRGG